jgi:hypothetical protein
MVSVSSQKPKLRVLQLFSVFHFLLFWYNDFDPFASATEEAGTSKEMGFTLRYSSVIRAITTVALLHS